MGHRERQSFSSWSGEISPSRILIIRLHAIGDVAITFPALHNFSSLYPHATIDYLVCPEASPLLEAIAILGQVHVLRYASNLAERIWNAFLLGLKLKKTRYDVVIDLQRNLISRMVRRIIAPSGWGEFDRYSLKPAGERVLETFHKTGFPKIIPEYSLMLKPELLERARTILANNGWDGKEKLFILNPAGLWETRNWPNDRYISLGKRIIDENNGKLLFIGTNRMANRVKNIEESFGETAINLVDRTTLEEAFAIVQYASLMVSEDSGLMHMGWVSGIPTIALFGSTQHRWSTPLGEHTVCLHSGDLECGDCMQKICKYGDVHCLTRYSSEQVMEIVKKILS